MRIVVVDSLYEAFVRDHYRARPGLRRSSYAEQQASLLSRSFGTSDAYSTGFRAAGHEAHDLLVNCGDLQLTWAAENGLRYPGRRLVGRLPEQVARHGRWRFYLDVALRQLEALAPDVVYVQDLGFLGPDDLRALRRRGAMLVGQLGSAPPGPEVLRCYDLTVTSFPLWVPRLRELGIAAEYFPIAFDVRVIDRLAAEGVGVDPAVAREHPVAFVGGVHPPHVHRGGTAFLERVVGELDAGVWGYVADRVPRDSPLLRRHGGEVWGLEMYAVLARTAIALNRHGDIAEGHANNMRLYEATGVGAVVVTEEAANLPGLFTPGEEIVTYRGADDLIATVRALLADDERRQAIAAAGQARTLREHTYQRRIPYLVEMIESHRR